MENSKTYIIADLVKELDVPRTTLKDWLMRYEDYIEFEIKGRRKVYSDSSLKVLKEIAEMRQEGKTAPEILLELSYKHPVNADFTHEVEVPKIETPEGGVNRLTNEHFLMKNNPFVEALMPIVKQQNHEMEQMLTNKLHDMAENLHEAQLASLLPIIKRQNERTERMLSSKLHDMTENIHRNQLDTTRVSRQSARRILLVIALILTLVVAVILTSSNIYYMLMHQRDDLRLVERNLEKNLEKSRELYISESLKRKQYEQEQMLKLKNLTKVLEENKANSSKEINALKSNLKEQQEVFTVMVEKYNKLVEEQRTGTEDLLRKVFSKEQGAVVDKIDELIKQGVKDKAQENKENSKILELREKIFELKRKIGTMEQEKAKAAALPTSYLPDPRKPVIRNVAPPATKPEIIEVPTKK
jgi:hypothetical protein